MPAVTLKTRRTLDDCKDAACRPFTTTPYSTTKKNWEGDQAGFRLRVYVITLTALLTAYMNHRDFSEPC